MISVCRLVRLPSSGGILPLNRLPPYCTPPPSCSLSSLARLPSSGGISPLNCPGRNNPTTRPSSSVVTPHHSPIGARPSQLWLRLQDSPLVALKIETRASLSVSGEVCARGRITLGETCRLGHGGSAGMGVACGVGGSSVGPGIRVGAVLPGRSRRAGSGVGAGVAVDSGIAAGAGDSVGSGKGVFSSDSGVAFSAACPIVPPGWGSALSGPSVGSSAPQAMVEISKVSAMPNVSSKSPKVIREFRFGIADILWLRILLISERRGNAENVDI